MAYPDLADARLEQLAAAAEEWQRLADLFAALEQDTAGEVTGPLRRSGWAGAAASAAFARLEVLDDELGVAALCARTAAIVLRRAVEDFTGLQQRLRAATDGAVAAGLTVDEQGRVFPPFLRLPDGDDPEQEAVYQRAFANVRIYTDVLAGILAEAADADHRVALALEYVADMAAGHQAWEYHQAGKAAQDAAAALGLSQAAIPAAGTDPAAAKAWWAGLSPDERQLYLTGWPQQVGALDGLPAADRDAANQQALRTFIGENVKDGRDVGNTQHDRAVYLLNRLEGEAGNDKTAPLYLLAFDPHADGQAVVAVGNPDTAAHTAVVVPGVGTELDEYHKELRRAHALHGASTVAADGAPVSVIAWLGYDTPGGGATGTDLLNAPFGFNSEAGAASLDTFVDGLRASHDPSPSHITGIGHSYGSTVYGEAASTGNGIAVDDIIAAGSPGMRVDHASDLTTGTSGTRRRARCGRASRRAGTGRRP